jgi:hypothetical protein
VMTAVLVTNSLTSGNRIEKGAFPGYRRAQTGAKKCTHLAEKTSGYRERNDITVIPCGIESDEAR